MKSFFAKPLLLSAVTLSLLVQPAFSLKLSEVVSSSKAVSKYRSFKNSEAFHCGRKAAFIKIKGQSYEILTFRVLGLENTKDYKNFTDLVKKLNLSTLESKTMTPYEAFPETQEELFHIKLTEPKAEVIMALRLVKPRDAVKTER